MTLAPLFGAIVTAKVVTRAPSTYNRALVPSYVATRSWASPGSILGPSVPACQPDPLPMYSLMRPLGPVFSHQPVMPEPIVDQTVRLSGDTDAFTSTSTEKDVGVHARSAGT